MKPILECRNLTKRYGNKTALDRINLSLDRGKIHFHQADQRTSSTYRRHLVRQWLPARRGNEKDRLLSAGKDLPDVLDESQRYHSLFFRLLRRF